MNVELIGGYVMLLVSQDENYEIETNLENDNISDNLSAQKLPTIPTMIIKKSEGEIIKEFIKSYPSLFSMINLFIKFEYVNYN